MKAEISCRLTKTLLLYVREANGGSIGTLLDGLEVDEDYLMDANQWVSHELLQNVYHRVIDLLGDDEAVYKMALASERHQSMGLLDRIVRLIGNPKLVYHAAPKYNKMLKLNGDAVIQDSGDDWVLLEDRYHDPNQKTCYDCDYTRGVLAGIPTMFGLPLAEVEELHCQVGDVASRKHRWSDEPGYSRRGCLYRVRWQNKARQSWLKGQFTRRKVYQKAIEDLQGANVELQQKYHESRKLSTQLDAANRELSASEKKYRLLAENVTDVIWTYSLIENCFTYMSPSVQRMRGYTVEEAMALSIQETLDPESASKVMTQLQKELAMDGVVGVDKDRSQTLTVKQNVSDGSYVWGEMTVSFIRDSEGRPVGLLGITRDIADRKLAEEALKKSEAAYRSFFETSSDFICQHDLQGKIMKINPAAVHAFRLPPDVLIGKSIADLIPPEVRHFFTSTYLNEISSQGKSAGVTKMQRGDYTKLYLEYHNKLVRPDGEDPYVLAIGRDVTERVQDKRELEKLQGQLLQSQKMQAVGTLAGGIAHDFNNILSAIMGYGELAQLEANESGGHSAHLDQIVKATDRARDLVKQLLAFSRRSETELKPIDLNQLVAQSVKMLEHTIPKMIDIEMKLAGGLDSVRADATQLEQVIMNLATNASDAMPEGGSMVFETRCVLLDLESADQHLDMSPGRYVLLRVTDTGLGMDKKTVSQIFDPFFTTKDIGKGTGLGLYTVYGIVEEHGGHITCDSELGRGTTFKIYLPAVEPESKPFETEEPSQQIAPGGQETILLVDDEAALRELGTQILQTAGYKVTKAASGEEALASYQQDPAEVDLVILDLGMPGMGGHKCLKELLAINPALKVLIASGYSAEGKVKDTLQEGAAGYIAKPFKRDQLLDMVRNILDT